VDWNGDGLLDLLVGEIRGRVGVYLNEGNTKAFQFAKPSFLMAAGKEIQVPHGDAGPCVADWDGDGVHDLIVGAGDGSVILYRNEGTAKEPKLAAGVTLVPPGTIEYDAAKVSPQPTRGVRAKVCVADWNGDGKLDLLVGDISNQKPETKELTPEETKRVAEARDRRDQLNKEYRELIDKYIGPKRVTDKGEAKKVRERMEALRGELTQLYKIIPRDSDTHGWVWLFERSAIAARGTR
jgi:hypothetical protein